MSKSLLKASFLAEALAGKDVLRSQAGVVVESPEGCVAVCGKESREVDGRQGCGAEDEARHGGGEAVVVARCGVSTSGAFFFSSFLFLSIFLIRFSC